MCNFSFTLYYYPKCRGKSKNDQQRTVFADGDVSSCRYWLVDDIKTIPKKDNDCTDESIIKKRRVPVMPY